MHHSVPGCFCPIAAPCAIPFPAPKPLLPKLLVPNPPPAPKVLVPNPPDGDADADADADADVMAGVPPKGEPVVAPACPKPALFPNAPPVDPAVEPNGDVLVAGWAPKPVPAAGVC